MTSQRARVRYRADDLWDTPDDGKIYEIIDGDLYVTPPPNWGHQSGRDNLVITIGSYVRDRGLGWIRSSPIGVKLDEHNAVEPDLIFIARERGHIIVPRGVEGAPDLVVEVLSPGTRSRDRGLKRRRYEAAGVAHYWMLDPRDRTLTALRLGADGYVVEARHGPGEVVHPSLFPGLALRLDDLWD
jgi:Uma2 family endonuclease